MGDPQSSNPLDAVFDAASEVAGNAIGALIDPFGSSTKSDRDDNRDEELDTTEQFDASAGYTEDSPDEDDDSDDDYDDGPSSDYTSSPQYQTPAVKSYEPRSSTSPRYSYNRSTYNEFSPRRDISDVNVGEVFSGVGKSVILGLCLYPVIGLGGCITRIVVQGPPPHPMLQEQAHDQWLNSPVQSWTTEAVIIPLIIIAITFLRGLIKIRHANPILAYILFVVCGIAAIAVGIELTKSFRKDSRASSTVSASSQPVGTTLEVNAMKLNMRSGPGSNYPVVATFGKKARIVSYGQTVRVNGELWTHAATPDGQTKGWVNRKFLSP